MRERAALAPEEIRIRSVRIQQRVVSLTPFVQAKSVALYCPFRGEVDTAWLVGRAREDGKKVVFPKIRRGELIFVVVPETASFRPGPFGIAEPPGNETRELKEIDCVVVPGVAFDPNGTRLGFGGGCYDRVLRTYDGVKVGLAYDFQMTSLPFGTADVPCDWVVSESKVFRRSLC